MVSVEGCEQDLALLTVGLGELFQDHLRDDVLVGHVPSRLRHELSDALQHLGGGRHLAEGRCTYGHQLTSPLAALDWDKSRGHRRVGTTPLQSSVSVMANSR